MDVPGLRAIVDALAGEGGHAPLKRDLSKPAIVLEPEVMALLGGMATTVTAGRAAVGGRGLVRAR
jgi:hypothetical protein